MDNQLNIGHLNMVSFVSHRKKNMCCMLEICVILVIHCLLYLNIYLKLTSLKSYCTVSSLFPEISLINRYL